MKSFIEIVKAKHPEIATVYGKMLEKQNETIKKQVEHIELAKKFFKKPDKSQPSRTPC